ncbi:SWIM zinc finger family protein [Corynebacterium sp. ES2794-CONJ1]|uniref:SWIM zinc finger family protein n=1 Tax=Corynebacterium sp. ES2794-CONJ1 TaxID=2980553 RepID=UPI0021D9C43C|nr:SWIM zinc finger family protein [Corynebacterium sp. ES2794-CONJ1]MCU9519297.1 SWIM zinc finger family protein [Corynebacterium sp. ES2794-CONJ1]
MADNQALPPNRHISRDNIIYANFHAAKRSSAGEDERQSPAKIRRIEGMRSHRKHERIPLIARRIVELVEKKTEPKRGERGRSYQRAGKVASLDFKDGVIYGSVAGTQNLPFDCAITLPYFGEEAKRKLIQLLLENPVAFERMRAGDFPHEVVDLLIGATPFDIRFSCDCPDLKPLCKHLVAVAYEAQEKIEREFEVALKMRGLSFAAIDELLVSAAHIAAQEKAKDATIDQEEFWHGGPVPPIPELEVHSVLDDSDLTLLHQAMRLVSFSTLDELRAVSDIEDIFDYLIRADDDVSQ